MWGRAMGGSLCVYARNCEGWLLATLVPCALSFGRGRGRGRGRGGGFGCGLGVGFGFGFGLAAVAVAVAFPSPACGGRCPEGGWGALDLALSEWVTKAGVLHKHKNHLAVVFRLA
ncbi:MAG: hypothetical protein DI584_03375 [Stenotrophomonas sp.]|nr:MAG: hypothetical protein DI584_03375 [Stenotrophomonas sp.]